MFDPRSVIDFHLFGRHRLETIELLPLGSSIREAVALYGEATNREPSEETADITDYTFAMGPYHQAVAVEWQQAIQSITW